MAVTDKFLIVKKKVTNSATNPPTVTITELMIPAPLGAVCADAPSIFSGTTAQIAALIPRTGPPSGKTETETVCVVSSNDTLAKYVTPPPVDEGTTPVTPDPGASNASDEANAIIYTSQTNDDGGAV